MHARIGKLHLGLNAGRTRNVTPRRPRHKVLQQRRLAGPRLATQDQHTTLTGPHTLQQAIESLALGATTKERWPRVVTRHGSAGRHGSWPNALGLNATLARSYLNRNRKLMSSQRETR